MVERTRFDGWPCPVARAVEVLGDPWVVLILRELFYGVRQFDVLQANLGVSRNSLTRKLGRLVDEGLLRRAQYQDRPARYEYRLTARGRASFDVMMALARWGDDWLSGEEGPPVVFEDVETGRRLRPVVVDEETGRRLDPRKMRVSPGPGFPEHWKQWPAVRERFGLDDDAGEGAAE